MNKEKLILIIYIFVTFLFGCVSQTITDYHTSEAILIQSKAQIKNNDETNTVKIEIALIPQKAIRLEITASLGVSVASVLMTPDEIVYALHSSKQYVTGPFNEKTLYPVFKKKINPYILWRTIHDQSMNNLNLNCQVDGQKRPIKCLDNEGTTIIWTYDTPPRKRIDIISNKFEMSWIFKEKGPLVESHNKTFVLKKPENYQEIIIK